MPVAVVEPDGSSHDSRTILLKEFLPPIYRLLLRSGSAAIRAQRSTLCGPRRCVHHAPESVSLGFQELGQHLFDSLNLLEEVCAFVACHGYVPARRGGCNLPRSRQKSSMETIDCYVMGSRTYETALSFEAKGFGRDFDLDPVGRALMHVMFLPQVQNRLRVQMQWLWSYVTGQRSSRLIPEPRH
jgi:hypothetical protein